MTHMQLDAIATMRFLWLLLTGMMLVSRALFQTAGPVRMRSFLDLWKVGRVRQAWGGLSLGSAVLVAGLAWVDHATLDWRDTMLVVLLVAVLLADGTVNALPAGFTTFKDRVQAQWVRRHAGTGREGDRHLFGVVNLGLALAAGAMAAVVILYRPVSGRLLLWASLTAVTLTPAMVALAATEHRVAASRRTGAA
jgi:hypothetical protein